MRWAMSTTELARAQPLSQDELESAFSSEESILLLLLQCDCGNWRYENQKMFKMYEVVSDTFLRLKLEDWTEFFTHTLG